MDKAKSNFFTDDNLKALRELSLRKTADTVNSVVQISRLSKGNINVLPTKEKIVACISSSPSSSTVIRNAARMASSFKTEWIALYVGNLNSKTMTDEEKKRLREHINLAERLGAIVEMIHGDDIVEAIIKFCNYRNVTKIIIGRNVSSKKALLKIKAGEITGYVPVIVLRDNSLKTEKVRLRIQLVVSNDLELGQAKNLIMLLNISDQLEQPVNWTRYSSVQSYLGAYSKPKHELMIEVLHDKVDENWLDQMVNDRPNLIFWRGKFQEALNAFNNDPANIASGKAPLRENPNDSNSAEVTFPSNV